MRCTAPIPRADRRRRLLTMASRRRLVRGRLLTAVSRRRLVRGGRLTVVGLCLAATATACATAGTAPSGAGPTVVTRVEVSAAAPDPGRTELAPLRRLPAAPGGGPSCADEARSAVQRAPGSSPRAVDPAAAQRARRALEAQRQVPRRADVPAAAVPGAEACVHAVQRELSLRRGGGGRIDEPAVRAALRSAGLTAVTVRPGPAFAASTGGACILGTFPAGEPALEIAPLAACQP